MANKPIETICVVGAGHMGWAFGFQCAVHGYPVWLHDIETQALESTKKSIDKELSTRINQQQLTPREGESIRSKFHFTQDLREAVAQADLVLETVPEKLELKRKIFAQLDRLCPSHTILATGSSSLPVSRIEDVTKRLDRVLNTHYYPPIWRVPMGELMPGSATSDETLVRVRQFMQSIGITPLMVRRESTGFLFNRIWRAIKKECLTVVDTGVATLEDVDRAWNIFLHIFKEAPGPFALMDTIGLDTILDIEMVYYRQSGSEADAPPRLLTDKVEKRELGVKAGKGFYTYPDPAFNNPGWLTGK